MKEHERRSGSSNFKTSPTALISGAGIAVACFALTAGFLYPESYPPYLDYDAAVEAIFVNNYNFQPAYDHSFRDSSHWQDRYVSNFATARLVFTIPLAKLQRAFGVEPHEMATFFKLTAAIFGCIGCLAAALPLFHTKRHSTLATFFVIGGSAIYPALFLLVRNGANFFVFAFMLFWISMWALVRHTETGRQRYLYALGVAIAWFALNPYPPLLALPIAMAIHLAITRRLWITLSNPHTYGALLLGVAVFFATDVSIGRAHHDGYRQYRERVSAFMERRVGTISIEKQLLRGSFRAKSEKYLNQHLHFSRDTLGDRWRADESWTLGASLISVYCALPFALAGLLYSVRRFAVKASPYLAVFAAVLAVFFTVSFPEGRYIAVLAPCYMFFLITGIERTCRRSWLSAIVATIFLLGFVGETLFHVTHRYNDFMLALWADRDGLREAGAHLPMPPHGGTAYISLGVPENRETKLYFLMNSNFKADWIPLDDLLRRLETEREAPSVDRYYYLGLASGDASIRSLAAKGFSPFKSFTSEPGGNRFALLRFTGNR